MNRVDIKKKFRATWKLAFTTPIEMKSPKLIEKLWFVETEKFFLKNFRSIFLLQKAKADEERRKKEIHDVDYLAPFLAAIGPSEQNENETNSSFFLQGNPERINAQLAQQLRVAAQRDFKDRSIRKANLMQARYENEVQQLTSKQQWFQKHQIGMSKEDEIEYQRLCEEAQFRLRILEDRLKRFVFVFSLLRRTNFPFFQTQRIGDRQISSARRQIERRSSTERALHHSLINFIFVSFQRTSINLFSCPKKNKAKKKKHLFFLTFKH